MLAQYGEDYADEHRFAVPAACFADVRRAPRHVGPALDSALRGAARKVRRRRAPPQSQPSAAGAAGRHRPTWDALRPAACAMGQAQRAVGAPAAGSARLPARSSARIGARGQTTISARS
jgi:hypothetical protein